MTKYVLAIIVQLMCINQVYADGLEPGVYYCITENLVGIQPIRLPPNFNEISNPHWVNKQNRKAGKVKPEKERFIVKVEKVDYKEKIAQGCFADFKPGVFKPSDNYCNAKLKITLPKEKVGNYAISSGELYSDSSMGNMFNNTFNIFWAAGVGRLHYTSVSLNGVYGNYLEEGSCEAF